METLLDYIFETKKLSYIVAVILMIRIDSVLAIPHRTGGEEMSTMWEHEKWPGGRYE